LKRKKKEKKKKNPKFKNRSPPFEQNLEDSPEYVFEDFSNYMKWYFDGYKKTRRMRRLCADL